ncbi:hypothetical protein bcgnr5372_38730 [Bacillus luti]|nr:hypothetical protein [Bacillus cereus]HDR8330706.1 hypothetical protein [Bacillus cereus]HDR8336443.1 hypothetical protein [Bacillus cereus]
MTKMLNETTKFKFECDNDRCTIESNHISTTKENAIELFEKGMKGLYSTEKLHYLGLINETGKFDYEKVITITEEYVKAS